MYLLLSAAKNIYHYKKRYLLNGILLFIVAIISSYAFLLYEACGVAANDIRQNLKDRYTFSLYYDIEPELYNTVIYKDQMLNYADSKYIDKAIFTFTNIVWLLNLHNFNNLSDAEMNAQDYWVNQFMLEGWSTLELNDIDDFRIGVCKLLEGRMFQTYGEIIINNEIAEKNMFKSMCGNFCFYSWYNIVRHFCCTNFCPLCIRKILS